MTSPTQRTLALLRESGWTAQVVERWVPQARKRVDLFGCIDLVAMRATDKGLLGVQATTAANLAARVTKALAEPRLLTWLSAGNRFLLHGWAKKGPAGARKLWAVNVREIVRADNETLRVAEDCHE